MSTQPAGVSLNHGRLVQYITGIQGVSPGSIATVQIPVNARYHRLIFQCTAGTTYATPPAVAMPAGAGGTLATLASVINAAGQVVAVTVTTPGSGMTPGVYALAFSGGGGTGAMATATVNAGGTLTVDNVLLQAQGGGGWVLGNVFFTNVKHQVGGTNIRDSVPSNVLGICAANGYVVNPGEYPVFFTEPWRNMVRHNANTSWDLTGQSTYQITMAINQAIVSPGLVGIMEFDSFRNVTTVSDGKGGTTTIPTLAIVTQHDYNFPLAGGNSANLINTIPFQNRGILRLWLNGATPNSITQFEVYQDGNKILEATKPQINELLSEYGFAFSNSGFSQAGVNGLVKNPFDAAYVADVDQRVWKALYCTTKFEIRVYSTVAQNLTITSETLTTGYIG